MRIVDFTGTHVVSSFDQIEMILAGRNTNGTNSIQLFRDDGDYPTLLILVKDDLATMSYVPNEHGAGFRSIGGFTELDPGDMTRFSAGRHEADDLYVLNEAVLPFEKVLKAAGEFFVSNELPKTVEWFEL